MIAALHPCSFVDFPGRLAAVVFTQGCNLRCRYCHNPELCSPMGERTMPRTAVIELLERRQGKLDGVVITGGEPTLHDDLAALLADVRGLGYATKLDTNGTRPAMVATLVEQHLLDFVAVDVKLPPGADSSDLCGTPNQGSASVETLAALSTTDILTEARTTVVRGIHDASVLDGIAHALSRAGVIRWRIQPVGAHRLLDRSVPAVPLQDDVLAHACSTARALGIETTIRATPRLQRTSPDTVQR